MSEHLTVVDHPLVQHKLTIMRDKETPTAVFRQLLREISQLLAYEVTRGLPMTTKQIETPMQVMDAPTLDGKKLALISILRAGNGLLDGVLEFNIISKHLMRLRIDWSLRLIRCWRRATARLRRLIC
jgi:uracil phosphoribosyltransferase